ncbi:MAG: hypothetical protein M1429_00125 [Patescibacteria group bacterium]|nr:hypothetical protein [Patescibacteria group bacterium]
MNPELQPSEEEITNEQYLNPEKVEPTSLEKIMKEGEILNVRPIEEHFAKIPKHADRVLIGEAHHDLLLEVEIAIPGENKKLLVVYKPESGISKGTDKSLLPQLPEKSSPYMKKEAATWEVAKSLELNHIAMPVVIRSLGEGEGSVRPFIWGESLESLSDEETDQALSNQKTLEELALFDYIIQNLDRRKSNLVWEENVKERRLKAIDHSLTFFDEEFASQFAIKGPRLMIAYDNSADPPTLKNIPLPKELQAKLEILRDNEKTLRNTLSELLTQEEISGIFNRGKKLLERKIFL